MQFFVSLPRLAFLLGICVLFVVASVLIVQVPDPVLRVIGSAGAIFFGACFVLILKRFWHGGVALEITPDEIHDLRHGVRVPWSEVRDVWVESVAGTPMLCLEVDEPERFLEATGRGRRVSAALTRASTATGFAPIGITFQELRPGIEEAWAFIVSLDLFPQTD